jgi:hypothetical protein
MVTMPEPRRRYKIDREDDRGRGNPGTTSRYGNYLDQNRGTFEDLISDGYDDPSVHFATAVWRIATGPIMSPPYVLAPQRVLSTSITRSDWDGEAIIDVTLICPAPNVLRDARTWDRSYFRDWPYNWLGDLEGVGGEQLTKNAYMLTSAQVLIRIKPGTLPRIDNIPLGGTKLLRQADECLDALVVELNREIGPLVDRLEGVG